MMDSAPLNSSALQDFLLDAQVLLTKSQECLQHLELIDNDPDACHCLNDALATLARRADTLGLLEVSHYTAGLQQLLAPACCQQHLPGSALAALQGCLTLLAWQLELVDVRTGRLNLDPAEQTELLGELASALGQPLPQLCGPCQESGNACIHPHPPHTLPNQGNASSLTKAN
ncbi:histidine kinase [Pseudomonas sp. S 311-6]|nr:MULTISPECIES: histidine kinase [Pseudomonas]MCO7563846.1 histidine kinase [Pseudomonas mosselii]MCO7615348.1 histidine kinase [Pseudomonas guariconensis]MCO7636311.1 histidine kinase [Pseudomonas sp. S 311-6]